MTTTSMVRVRKMTISMMKTIYSAIPTFMVFTIVLLVFSTSGYRIFENEQ